jgi:hypothetical protein
MVEEFAKALQADADYLYFLAGVLPADIRNAAMTPEAVVERFKAFRKS